MVVISHLKEAYWALASQTLDLVCILNVELDVPKDGGLLGDAFRVRPFGRDYPVRQFRRGYLSEAFWTRLSGLGFRRGHPQGLLGESSWYQLVEAIWVSPTGRGLA
ncbi:hypothetical protein Pfo_009854 [Paulownia fortunei]|nr:hypothetical protein Pfo_009854 [Paulownia fortunei]